MIRHLVIIVPNKIVKYQNIFLLLLSLHQKTRPLLSKVNFLPPSRIPGTSLFYIFDVLKIKLTTSL